MNDTKGRKIAIAVAILAILFALYLNLNHEPAAEAAGLAIQNDTVIAGLMMIGSALRA